MEWGFLGYKQDLSLGYEVENIKKNSGRGIGTSAISEGRAMREVPVSIAAPVFSNSRVSWPKEKLSRPTSQYPRRRTGSQVILPV